MYHTLKTHMVEDKYDRCWMPCPPCSPDHIPDLTNALNLREHAISIVQGCQGPIPHMRPVGKSQRCCLDLNDRKTCGRLGLPGNQPHHGRGLTTSFNRLTGYVAIENHDTFHPIVLSLSIVLSILRSYSTLNLLTIASAWNWP